MLQPILITGASGMLGKAFTRLLHARNVDPVLLDRDALDITDEKKTTIAIHAYKPKIVLNCAAYTKVDQAELETRAADAINGDGVGYLASVCEVMGAKLVHFSTDYVFDGTLARPLKINDPAGPRSAYGRSKLLGETRLKESPLKNWLLIRTAWLYGPGRPNFVRTMVNAARAGKPLKVVADQLGSPTFTDDLAEATLDLLDATACGTFHVTNAGATTWFDFASAILDEFGLDAPLSPTTAAEWKASHPQSAVRPAYSVLDCSDYSRITAKHLPDWRDALHRYRQFVDLNGF